jgi:hypothetical protein
LSVPSQSSINRVPGNSHSAVKRETLQKHLCDSDSNLRANLERAFKKNEEEKLKTAQKGFKVYDRLYSLGPQSAAPADKQPQLPPKPHPKQQEACNKLY